MPEIERITVTMPRDLADRVRRSVEEGEYATTSEVVREAVRDWTRRQEAERSGLELLRELVRDGETSGAGIPAADVFAELHELISRRRSRDA